ncbi:MAG: inorganic phosphate transporter [Candidatus Hadarchaeales archaeon]
MIELLIYAVGIVLSFLMALALGMNDASNPTDCTVGSGVLSIKRALILFAVFSAAGGILVGPFVMKTVDRGLIPREQLSLEAVAVGSFTAVLSAVIWIVFSTWKGMPVSTTHSVVGGIIGFGLVFCPAMINWNVLLMVVVAFIVAPISSMLLANGMYRFFRWYLMRTKGEGGYHRLIFLFVFIISSIVLISTLGRLLRLDIYLTVLASVLASLLISSAAVHAVRSRSKNGFNPMRSFSYLLIISLCFSAFSFGANDMANCTGVFITPTEKIIGGMPTSDVMFLLSVLGAIGIAIGGIRWGKRVVATSAYRVTKLDPVSGAAGEYSNALVIFLFTVLPAFLVGFGIPVSTTHSSVGSIIGVGVAMRGIGGIDRKTIGKIMGFWVATIPCVALISMGLFWLFSRMVVIA